MTTNQTIDGVPRELLERITAGPSQTDYIKAWKELRALLDAPALKSSAIGHIEQRRSMGLAIGSPITNVVWDIPHPELQHLPDGAKVYLHPAAQPQRIEYSSLDPVERLAVCRGERQQGKSHIAALLEDLAKQVYQSWESQPGFVPWVDGGNSLKQGEARQIASRTFELALANQVGGDL